jgi:hypothetical protein
LSREHLTETREHLTGNKKTLDRKGVFTMKSNNKKAIENIKAYVMDGFTGDNYQIEKPATFDEAAKIIWNCFQTEKVKGDTRGLCIQALWEEWCSGLPSILDCCYWYNRSAVNDLGNILEQSKEEREKYSEDKAEKVLTRLLYREIEKGARRYNNKKG